jgi:hypothetical protein
MTHRTWQDNAEEFAALDQGEGWPFARLIACSVERIGQGTNPTSYTRTKSTPDEFAKQAGTSRPRVIRYLDAWGRAAERGWVPHAAELSPEDAHRLTDPEQPWSQVYAEVLKETRTRKRPEEPTQVWTVVMEARKLVADMETLVAHCGGVSLSDDDVRAVLREAVKRLTSGLELLSAVMDDTITDDRLHAWMDAGGAA